MPSGVLPTTLTHTRLGRFCDAAEADGRLMVKIGPDACNATNPVHRLLHRHSFT